MASYGTDFTPQTHGFTFANRFPYEIPNVYELPYTRPIALRDIVPGWCGGICFAALDYFTAGQPVSRVRAAEDLSPDTLTFIAERHLDSLSLPVVLKTIEWTMLEDAEISAQTSRLEIPRLRRWLRRGVPAPLMLIRRSGADAQYQNTIVLALGINLASGGRRAEIPLYDPDRPGEVPVLVMQRLRGPGRVVFSLSTGDPVRGFFLLPYMPRAVPEMQAAALAAVAFEAVGLPFTLLWPVDSRRVNQFFNVNKPFYAPFGLPGHEGLDLYANTGANIYAAADGEIASADSPRNHPYGLHVRIKHQQNGKSFTTIYAHLSKVYVAPGLPVTAGQLIGQADNTGNSFGSHLHLTLKIDGETTPGFPPGIVDPFPYLSGTAAAVHPVDLPPPSGITVFTLLDLNLRAGPSTNTEVLAGLPSGERLSALGDAAQVAHKIGKEGQWLQVQTANGTAGYVAAWYVANAAQAFPPSDLVVYADDLVNLRSGPGTTFSTAGTLDSTVALTVLGDGNIARAKLGKEGEWLQVQTADGKRGYVAAWLVHATGQTAPPSGLTVYATASLNVRARPSTDANILTLVTPVDALTVLGNRDDALARIGVQGQWLHVQTPGGFTGYAAAWFITTKTPGSQPSAGVLMVTPTTGINLRAQPSVNSARIGGAEPGETLKVLESDLAAAQAKIGKQDQWLFVQKPGGDRGYAAAWFVR